MAPFALNGAKRSTENTESLLPEPDASRSHVRHSQAPRAFNGPYACDIVDAALALDFGAGVRGCEQYCNELFSIGYSLRQVSRYDILLNFFFFFQIMSHAQRDFELCASPFDVTVGWLAEHAKLSFFARRVSELTEGYAELCGSIQRLGVLKVCCARVIFFLSCRVSPAHLCHRPSRRCCCRAPAIV